MLHGIRSHSSPIPVRLLLLVGIFFLTGNDSARAGTFAEPTVIRSGQSPEAWVRMADLDCDGDGDIVYSPSAGKMDVLLRKEDGTWNTVSVITSGMLRVLHAAVADFDLNGLPDLAAYVQRSAGETGILTIRQTGPGIFSPETAVYFNLGAMPAALAPLRTADLDGDGRLDLLFAWKTGTGISNQGRAGWMRGVGGAALFASPSAFFLQVFDEPCDIVAADFDRDGRMDVAVADNAAAEVRICPGSDFTPPNFLKVPVAPRHLALMDHNRDGWQDLLIAHAELGTAPGLGLRVYYGSAAGFLPDAIADFASISVSPQSSLAVADVNLDGRQDALLGGGGSAKNCVTALIARKGEYADLEFSPFLPQLTGAMTSCDDDRDGDTDLIAVTTTGLVRMANLTPHRVFTEEGTAILSASGTLAAGAAAYVHGDFNRDGRQDVATATASDGKIRLFLNSGSAAPGHLPVADNANCRWLSAADFDGDGDLDLAAPSLNTGRVIWYSNSGTGNAWTAHIIPWVINTPIAISTGDLNLDGRPDLVTASATGGNVHQILNMGDGVWTGKILADLTSVRRVEVSDVYAGGRPEILVQHGSGGAVSLLRLGLGGWEKSVLHPAQSGTGGEGLAIGDLDGNGLPDVARGYGQQIHVALQTAPGTFGPSTYFGSDSEFLKQTSLGVIRSLKMADLDLDGISECVAVFDKGIGAFSMERPQRGRRPPVLLAEDSPQFQGDVALVRFDADAVPDVIHHSTTGTRLQVHLSSAPVLSIRAVPAWTPAGTMNYPVQDKYPIVFHRFTVINAAWPGDLPVRLTRLQTRFRRDNAALTPLDPATFSQFFTSFSLWEDAGQPGVPEIGTFEPYVSALTPGVPDAAGLNTLELVSPAISAPGTQRTFFLAGTTGLLFSGWGFRVELPSGPQETSADYASSVGGKFFPAPLQSDGTSSTARFILASFTPRQQWRYFYFYTPVNMGIASDYADPDLDGMPNILEYALGQDPKVPGRPRMELQVVSPRCYVSFWGVPFHQDVGLALSSSTDLSVWYQRGIRPTNHQFWSTNKPGDDLFPGDPEGSLLQQVLSTPLAPGAKEFFRLHASELAP